jgi:hypothetical protein
MPNRTKSHAQCDIHSPTDFNIWTAISSAHLYLASIKRSTGSPGRRAQYYERGECCRRLETDNTGRQDGNRTRYILRRVVPFK